jgi:glycosyltransferase involved in cell wall biosynthesis
MNADTKDQDYFRTIHTRAAKIKADIRFLPSLRHSEFVGLCKQSSLVVMNPISDGSPVTAMETMALGVPVILPPLEYDKDVFEHAWFFDKWESSVLARCIEEVLASDEAELIARVDASLQKVKRSANIETEMAKVQDIYAGLTE